jgi:hypothetical protein
MTESFVTTPEEDTGNPWFAALFGANFDVTKSWKLVGYKEVASAQALDVLRVLSQAIRYRVVR